MELAKLRAYAEAARWSQGYLEDLLDAACIEGDTVTFDPSIHATLQAKYGLGSAPFAEPGLTELAGNFGRAVAKWASAGFPVVEEGDYQARLAACQACSHWDGAARLGLGKCRAPKCGCTRLKLWLRTEKCPMGKWT